MLRYLILIAGMLRYDRILIAGILRYDRIICDVPCSGDGTIR